MSNIKSIKQIIKDFKDLKDHNEKLKKERNKLREDLDKIKSDYEITHKEVKDLSRQLFKLMNPEELKKEVDSSSNCYEQGDGIFSVDSSALGV